MSSRLPDEGAMSDEIVSSENESELLLGFKKLNVKLIYISGDIDNLFKKKKYEIFNLDLQIYLIIFF